MRLIAAAISARKPAADMFALIFVEKHNSHTDDGKGYPIMTKHPLLNNKRKKKYLTAGKGGRVRARCIFVSSVLAGARKKTKRSDSTRASLTELTCKARSSLGSRQNSMPRDTLLEAEKTSRASQARGGITPNVRDGDMSSSGGSGCRKWPGPKRRNSRSNEM